jgi:hypothetical protein
VLTELPQILFINGKLIYMCRYSILYIVESIQLSSYYENFVASIFISLPISVCSICGCIFGVVALRNIFSRKFYVSLLLTSIIEFSFKLKCIFL